MDIIISMIIVFFLLIFSVINNFFIGYPLFIALIIFGLLSLRRNYFFLDVLKMAYEGGKKSLIVLQVFSLIGILTAMWMSAGTIPAIVYYGIKFMDARFFIFYSFIITSLVSFLLGTAFGTVSTIGVAIIVMAKSGDINLAIVTGAIMSGAYFGDRCSPMSSSATLISNLTATNIFDNIKKMFNTGKFPFIITTILYLGLSLENPMIVNNITIDKDLSRVFNIGLLSFTPAIIILVASFFRVKVKKSMTLSIIGALFISHVVEGFSFNDLLKFSIFGFNLDDGLIEGNILNRGGFFSMVKAGVIVFISCSIAGILNGTQMLNSFQEIYRKAQSRFQLFFYTVITSILTSVFGCNQTISIVLTEQLLRNSYSNSSHSKELLSIDLENTTVIVAPLIPWNIGAYIATTTLGVSLYAFIPYAFYLYLIPLWALLSLKVNAPKVYGTLKPL